jgi:hypothetical protein
MGDDTRQRPPYCPIAWSSGSCAAFPRLITYPIFVSAGPAAAVGVVGVAGSAAGGATVIAPVSCALAEQLVPREQWAAVAVPDVAVFRAAATYSEHVASRLVRGEAPDPDNCDRCRRALTAAAVMLHAAADAIAVAELRNGLDNELEPRRHGAGGDELALLDELIDSTRERITELGGQP